MLRIVGIETDPDTGRELVLLQNQGALSAKLKGHGLATHLILPDGGQQPFAFLFEDDVLIPRNQYVLLCSGRGQSRWQHSSDGRPLYVVYTGLCEMLWGTCNGRVELLRPCQCFHMESSVSSASLV